MKFSYVFPVSDLSQGVRGFQPSSCGRALESLPKSLEFQMSSVVGTFSPRISDFAKVQNRCLKEPLNEKKSALSDQLDQSGASPLASAVVTIRS